MENRLLPEVEHELRLAGWFPNWQVEEAQLLRWLNVCRKEFGCHVFPEAVRVLKSYGGLVIGSNSGSSAVHVDPLRHGMFGDPELWFLWEWELGEVLFPIGSLASSHLSFGVSTNGKIFAKGLGDFDCGASFENALANLLLPGRQVRELVDVITRRKDLSLEENALTIYRAIEMG